MREAQVVVGVAQGLSNAEIGEKVGIETNTVKTHLQRIYKKVGVAHRQGLVLWGYQSGRLMKLPPPEPLPYGTRLTSREVEMTIMVIKGLSNKEIGKRVFLSEDTVKTHLRRTFKKVGAKNRAHLITLAWQHGLAPHEAWEPEGE